MRQRAACVRSLQLQQQRTMFILVLLLALLATGAKGGIDFGSGSGEVEECVVPAYVPEAPSGEEEGSVITRIRCYLACINAENEGVRLEYFI